MPFRAVDFPDLHRAPILALCLNRQSKRSLRSSSNRRRGEAPPHNGHPWFYHSFSLFQSYRAVIRGLIRRTPSVWPLSGLEFRSLGLLRNRRPISVPGTPGLCVLTIPTRSYRIRLHVSACYPYVRSLKKRRPAKIILDLDSTDDHTHGQQEFSFYHGYYRNHISGPATRLPTGSTSDRPKGAANWTVTTRPICPPKASGSTP